MIVFIVSAVVFNVSFSEARVATPQLFDKNIFGENEQSSAIVHSRFNDGSTNIIFYIDYGNNNFQYNAETIGHGDLPFSDYYAPAPGIGKYIAVEYFNDGGTFGCSGFSLNECIADPHFISQFGFEVTADQTLGAITTTAATTTAATTTAITTTSTNETGIIPFIINGILDFFGINTTTTTTFLTDLTAASLTSSADATATTSTPTSEAVGVPTASVGTVGATTSVSFTTTTTEGVAITTNPPGEEIILPPQGEVTSSPLENTTSATHQASKVNSFLATIVGMFNLGLDDTFIAIVTTIGVLLLLAFILYRIAQWLIVKRKR